MNCTTETKKVFNVRKEKSINICLWYHSTDRCPTMDPHKKDNRIQPWLTWLLKNRSMVGNPLRVLHEPFSSPAILINALSKNHKTRLSFQTKHQQLPPPSSHPILEWDSALCFVERDQLSLRDKTKIYGCSSYSSYLHRQRATLPTKTPTLLYIPDVSLFIPSYVLLLKVIIDYTS